jgi:uncharacterized protein involved in exopolysaccharide biosynthesis
MEPYRLELGDYLAIARRRIWAFVIPTLIALALAVPVVLLLPPTYRSTATILIEDQSIPSDLVRATVSSYAAERLEVITQRVTATQNLVDLINKLDLYRDLREREAMSDLAGRVRKAFTMRLVEAKVTKDAGGGRTTIAFKLSFEDRSPEKAQAVVNELVSLYISENFRTRRANAEETKRFLEQELQRTNEQVTALEAALARFKEQNAGNLPEQLRVTMGVLDRAEQQLLTVQRQLGVLRERKIYLDAQLTQVDPHVRVPEGAKLDDLTPQQRLSRLRAQLPQLRARYGAAHPEVTRVVRQIEILAAEVAKEAPKAADDSEAIKRDLAAAKRSLAIAKEKYAAAHPEVVRLQRQVEMLEQTLRELPANKTKPENAGLLNPIYVKLKADLAAADSEIKSLVEQEERLKRQVAELVRQTSRAPQVERDYSQLQRNLEAALASQRELSVKLRRARLGESLEVERKSERFSLLDPADLPREPASPNRPAFLLVAFVFALGLGAATVASFEAHGRSIYGPKHLAALTGVAPLVVLPVLPASVRARHWRRWITVAGVAILFIVAYLLIVQAEILGPVEVLQTRFETVIQSWLRKLGL